MKGDFTRDTFNPANHFLRVLTQQGRVQLDADANEQIAILLHYLQTLAADLIGPYGGPNGNLGFAIITQASQIDNVDDDEKKRLEAMLRDDKLLIGPGHYYVDGVLCEQATYEGYATQPNYPLAKVEQFENPPYLLYLDVWERHLTHLDDPSIRDVALNGADTATRSQVVWHVRAWPHASEQFTDVTNALRADLTTNGVHTNWSEFQELWQPTNRGQLKAKALEASSLPTSPCNVPPNARYRGVENRLYRVEIHHGGGAAKRDGKGDLVINPQPATFKWSRDNGSVVGMGRIESTGLHLSDRRNEARDAALNPWVELCNDTQELRGEPGEFVQRSDVHDDHPKVRCWDGRDGTTPIQEDNWLDLEDGIQIQFQSAPSDPSNTYRTGDYWLIPARAATGDVEWPGPVVDPEALPPHGITHHYAPLASITALGNEDLRRNFKHSSS